jgi:hypothetical protein
MTRFARRSLAVAVAASAVSAVTLVSAASAATISVGAPCHRYLPGIGIQQIQVTGLAFTPNGAVNLAWSSGDSAGFTPVDPAGSFLMTAVMPNDFIGSNTGQVKTYTLTATEAVTGLTASTPATFVRAGADVRPRRVRRNLRQKVRWSVYGPRTGSTVYAHWVFKGRRRATRRLGRAAGPCGITHKRASFLPARPRNGTWRVYFTLGRKYSRSRAFYRMELNVFRTFSSRAAAARMR